MRLDAHQHFWKYDAVEYNWINDDMSVIRKNFFPADLLPLLVQNNIDGCIAVQARQSEEETNFLTTLSNENNFIKGVVGWVDLQADNVEERLAHFSNFKIIKGFRHVLQGEEDRALMLRPAFKRGITLLKKFGFTYDILIFPDQLRYVPEFVASFPDQKFVIDHIAKPDIKNKRLDEWKKNIEAVAVYENVFCKLSGMVTEADWQHWQQLDFNAYIDVVLNCFSVNRVMFGSDWPVCSVAASYDKVCNILEEATNALSAEEKKLLWGINCKNYYNI